MSIDSKCINKLSYIQQKVLYSYKSNDLMNTHEYV